MKKLKILSVIVSLFTLVLIPVVSFAQPIGSEDSLGAYDAYMSGSSGSQSSSGSNLNINCALTNLNSVVTCVSGVMQASVWLLMTAAFIYTIYGAVRFIGAEGKDREKWRSVMVYGIIGLFVITSIWGLVSILDVTFGLGKTPLQAPQFVAP